MGQNILFIINIAMYAIIIIFMFIFFYMYKCKSVKEIWKVWRYCILIEIILNIVKLVLTTILQNNLEPIFAIFVLLIYIIVGEMLLKKIRN